MRTASLAGMLLMLALPLAGCGDADRPPSVDLVSAGNKPAGAPLGTPRSNRSVLQTDATQYRPAPAGTGGPRADGGGPGAGPSLSGDADSQVRDAVRDLVSLILDGEAQFALRIFNSAEVSALVDNTDPLFATFEQLDALRRSVAEKLGDAEAARLDRVARGVDVEPTHRVLDAQNASIDPVPTTILIGPERTPGSARLTLIDGQWRLHLDRTLSGDDVDAIRAYHAQLGERLARVHDWVIESQTIDAGTLENALRAALRGEDFDLGAAPADGTAAPEEEREGRQIGGGFIMPPPD